MTEKHIVRLMAEEREELTGLVSKGNTSAAKIRHTQEVLLKADVDGPNLRIAEAFSMHLNTVAGIRKLWVCQGVEAALNRQPQAPSVTHPQASWMRPGKPGCWGELQRTAARSRALVAAVAGGSGGGTRHCREFFA